VAGLFALDKQITVQPDGAVEFDADLSKKLEGAVRSYVTALRRAQHEPRTAS
jgi:hypothetical protein